MSSGNIGELVFICIIILILILICNYPLLINIRTIRL